MSDQSIEVEQRRAERIQGIQSGELFARLNGAELFAPSGTLHGAQPFLQKMLHLQEDNTSTAQRLVQPSEANLSFIRKMRRQIRQRRRAAELRWRAVRDVITAYDLDSMEAIANHLSPLISPSQRPLDRYLQQFQRLEQAHRQHVTSNVLHLYALLEAEGKYITAWMKREESKCQDQRALTKLLYQFNSFGLQLESETSGQVRLWRLPPSDPQRIRCTKVATENIKKNLFVSSSRSLEVLEVYKIENRVLLNNFQRFASTLAQTSTNMKIKGLFCSVPVESVERCVVYGMHNTPNDGSGGSSPRFLDPNGAEVKIFSRPTLLQNGDDAPGTRMQFRARSKVNNGVSLCFPRRFSRYSTLEEMRPSLTNSSSPVEDHPPVQYLGLCRVALGKVLQVKDDINAAFPEDPDISALHFANEEYLVRYPDAAVPEFLIQFRVMRPVTPLPVDFSDDSIIPVSLTSTTPSLMYSAFQDFIYSPALDSLASTISAFPLSLPATAEQTSFFSNNGQSSPAVQEEEEARSKVTEAQQVSADIVLASCARQKAHLREDLQRMERLFWTRARELWEEEGIRGGVDLKHVKQPQNSRDNGDSTARCDSRNDSRAKHSLQAKAHSQRVKHSARNPHKRVTLPARK